jgi:hypothetical protein
MHRPWLGARRVAFVPVIRPVDATVPPDLVAQVERRVFYDPDPATGADRSLRTYVRTVSGHRADLDGVVFQPVRSQTNDPHDAAIAAVPSPSGFDHIAAVPLSEEAGGSGTAEADGLYFRASLGSCVGVWAMELTHSATGFWDLYLVTPNLDRFDNMACNCGTHPSTFTKLALQWLDPGTVRTFTSGTEQFRLHATALEQPPPPGHATAVRIATDAPSPYFMLETRLRVDAFDRGIPSEGVILYEVENPDIFPDPFYQLPVIYLRTPTALGLGEFHASEAGDFSLWVTGRTPGGFQVRISRPAKSRCEMLREEAKAILMRAKAPIRSAAARQADAVRLREVRRLMTEWKCTRVF